MTTAHLSFLGRRTIAAILIIALCFSPIARAQDGPARFEAADKALNRVYRTITQSAPSRTTEPLRNSQRIWIEFRDANAALAATGMTGTPNAAISQKASDTEHRVVFLESYFIQAKKLRGDPNNNALATIDRQLNEEYKAMLSGLPKAGEAALRGAQRAWVTARDADLGVLKSVGAIRATNAEWTFVRSRTEERVAFLRKVRTGPGSARIVSSQVTAPQPQVSQSIPARLVSDLSPAATPTIPVPPRPSLEVVTRFVEPTGYINVALDMQQNLLVAYAHGQVDFWDVQTGSLIRRVSTPATGWMSALHNLGDGFLVLATKGKYERMLQWLHRDADRALWDANPDTNTFFFCEGGMAAPEAGLVAYFGYKERPANESNPAGRKFDRYLFLGGRKTTERAFSMERMPLADSWSLSADGSLLLLSFTSLSNEGEKEAHLAAYAMADGRLLGQYHITRGTGEILALCSANGPDQFFMNTSDGSLLLLQTGRGTFTKAGQPLHLAEKPGEKRTWLCSTSRGWCVYGRGYERGSSRTLASDNAPEAVHRAVALWKDVRAVSVDRAGEFAGVVDNQDRLLLYHLTSGQVVRQFGLDVGDAFATVQADCSSDGKYFVTGRSTSRDGQTDGLTVRVLDIAALTEHQLVVQGITWNTSLGVDRATGRTFVYGNSRDQGERLAVADLRSNLAIPSPVTGKAKIDGYLHLDAGLLVGDTTVNGKKYGLAIEAASKRELIRFPLLNANKDTSCKAYHPATKQALIFDSAREVLTLHDLKSADSATPSWNLRADDPLLHTVFSFRFDHSGRQVVASGGRKRDSVLRMINFAEPGKIRWERGISEHSSEVTQFTPDDQKLLVDDHPFLCLLSAATGKELCKYPYEGACVAVAEDASRAFISTGQGGYEILNKKGDGFENVVRYLPGPGDSFALILPSGHYLSHGDAFRMINFAKAGRSQPADSFDVKYNRPDLVANALGAAPELVQAFRLTYEKRLARLGIQEKDLAGNAQPPSATIDYNKAPLTTDARVLRLPVDIKPGDAPLAAFEITVNDVPIIGRNGRALTGAETRGFAGEIEVELASGSNKVTVWARDAKGLTSSRVSVNVAMTGKAQRPQTLYVLAVGINEYLGEISPLTLAKKDAMDIAQLFEKNARPAFAEVKTKLLLDRDATRRGILDARSFFAEAGVEDQVVIFMSAHGVLDAEYEYRFCSTDTDLKKLPETTLTYGEIESLLDDCRARKRIVMLDTCHAGEPDRDDPRLAQVRVPASKGVRSIPFQPVVAPGVGAAGHRITDLLERHFVDLRIGAGAAVLASSTAQQQSLEAAEVNNGLFTAAVLTGLKQRKADFNGDGAVRVSELLRYCQEEVRQLSNGVQEPVSRHVNLADDFPVVTYR